MTRCSFLALAFACSLSMACRPRGFHASSKSHQVAAPAGVFAGGETLTVRVRLPLARINFMVQEEAVRSKCIDDLETATAPEEISRLEKCIDAPTRQDYAGEVQESPGRFVKSVFKIRGENSVVDCEFKKLKVELTEAPTPGSWLDGMQKFRIATHCLEDGERGTYRIGGGHVAWRQAALYPLLDVVGLPRLGVARAEFTYEDTSPADDPENPPYETLVRKGFLLENAKAAGKRLGGRTLEDEEREALTDYERRLDPVVVMKTLLFQSLIGNGDYDYGSKFARGKIRNFEIVQMPAPDARGFDLQMVAYDFDLATVVNGPNGNESNLLNSQNLVPIVASEVGIRAAAAAHDMARLATSGIVSLDFFMTHFEKAAQDYLARKEDLGAAVRMAVFAPDDDHPNAPNRDGRKLLQEHVDGFLKALENRAKIVAYVQRKLGRGL